MTDDNRSEWDRTGVPIIGHRHLREHPPLGGTAFNADALLSKPLRGNLLAVKKKLLHNAFGKLVKRRIVDSQRPPVVGITAFTGPPGAGKTLALEREAAKWHNAGFKVITNGMDLAFEAGSYKTFDQLTELLMNQENLPWPQRPWLFVALDEAPNFANARKWDEFPDRMFAILQQIRKYKLIFMYSSIDYLQTDKNLRRLTGWVWECTYNKPWPMLRSVTGGSFTMRRFPPVEDRKQDQLPEEKIVWRPRQRDFQSYDTGQILARASRIEKQPAKKARSRR